jgi:hypothetical protein
LLPGFYGLTIFAILRLLHSEKMKQTALQPKLNAEQIGRCHYLYDVSLENNRRKSSKKNGKGEKSIRTVHSLIHSPVDI